MPLNLFHRLRNSVNWTLSPVGFAIQRTQKSRWRLPSSIIAAKVGRYVIEVPGINPMSSYYESNPEFTGQLGLLTSLTRKKYPAMAAIDIGANVGDTACVIKTAEDVPVLCIEGDEKSFEFLQKNIAQLGNTTAHKLFLGEKTDTIFAEVACAGWNATVLPGSSGSAKPFKVVRLDDFIATQPGSENYQLLKIDTEGFDCAIIRGAQEFIRRVQPVIFFEYNLKGMKLIGERGIDTLFLLAEWGYSRVTFHDSNGRLILGCTLADREIISDLHHYADSEKSAFHYLDITAFHERDTDIALKYLEIERAGLVGSPTGKTP
jgi:FkbM family methyltransferase